MATYYSSKLTLAASTALYTDNALTTLAPTGYYSADGISRQQAGGLLQTQASCAPCVMTPYTVLSLSKYAVDIEDSYFTFKLTNSLLFDITISNAKVSMFTNIDTCNLNGTPAYQDICANSTIVNNTLSIIGNGTVNTPCNDLIGYYYHAVDSVNITIGANTYTDVNNGDKINIGGINGVDIYIQLYPSCSPVSPNCVVNAIDACYNSTDAYNACCDCLVRPYALDLCSSTVDCYSACHC